MAKVLREVATKEINGWLDKKKIKDSQREANKDSIESLIEAVMDGDMVVDSSTNLLKYTLLFPVGENAAIKELTFKPRLNDSMLEPHMKGVKATDVYAVLLAHIAALTDTAKNILNKVDSNDMRIARSIAVFFM